MHAPIVSTTSAINTFSTNAFRLLHTHTTDRDLWGEDAVLHYKTTQKEFPFPYVLYVDFKTFIIPSVDKDSVSEHIPSGFCCLEVSKFDGEIFELHVYSGPDVSQSAEKRCR